ncbi:MAG: hypothetical protein HUU02_12605 [Bacteroidetes bacterium]|nr:hypothetical protein [Bacteroidota bacterium]
MGTFMMRLGGLFIPAARETVEMMYQFTQPFIVDASKFQNTFGFGPTPLDESLYRTVEWFRSKHGPAGHQ